MSLMQEVTQEAPAGKGDSEAGREGSGAGQCSPEKQNTRMCGPGSGMPSFRGNFSLFLR